MLIIIYNRKVPSAKINLHKREIFIINAKYTFFTDS